MSTADLLPCVPNPIGSARAEPAAGAAPWLGLGLNWAYGLLPLIAWRIACPERAQDVLHEALLRYASRRGAVVDQPQAYLRRTIDSVLADHRRDAQRYQPLPDEDSAPMQGLAALSAQQIAELRERLAHVQRVLRVLPPRAREVFWLFRIEGWKQDAIAARLGISRNMVERHVMRAMVGLRQLQRQTSE